MRVLTIGTFDLFHRGHARLLDRAHQMGDLHVGINTDEFVTRYKGRAPVDSYEARAVNIVSFSDYRYGREWPIWPNPTAGIDLIRQVQPVLLVIGTDWLGRDYPAQLDTTADQLAALGISVLFVPRTPGISTTQLREAAA